MTNKELFIQAFIEADDIKLNKYFDKSQFTHQFSESFEKKMSKMIAKDKRIRFSTRRKVSKALIAALIAIIVMFTGLMSVSASRERIIEFIENILSQYTQVTVIDKGVEIPDTIEKEYTINDIPDEFTIAQYDKDNAGVFTVWKNEKGEEIVLIQEVLNSDTSIDNENYYEKIEINGYTAYLYGDNSTSLVSWTDSEYWFTISVPNQYKYRLLSFVASITEKS